MKYIGVYLLVINIVTFFVYGADKQKAKKDEYRISEKTLFLLAWIGGSIGAIIGMQFFRHKTKHAVFKYGIPAILILEILIMFMVLNFL